MYPEQLVAPMREELTIAGFEEFKTAEEVDAHLESHQGTTLVVINSVCGCAAGALHWSVISSRAAAAAGMRPAESGNGLEPPAQRLQADSVN